MAEAEFISELVLAMEEGIREGNKAVIDNAYRDYDDRFPNRKHRAAQLHRRASFSFAAPPKRRELKSH